MEIHRSGHEAMHYTYLKMEEGDERRHKGKCKFYREGKCYYDDNSVRSCFGSAHCDNYSVKEDNNQNIKPASNFQQEVFPDPKEKTKAIALAAIFKKNNKF